MWFSIYRTGLCQIRFHKNAIVRPFHSIVRIILIIFILWNTTRSQQIIQILLRCNHASRLTLTRSQSHHILWAIWNSHRFRFGNRNRCALLSIPGVFCSLCTLIRPVFVFFRCYNFSGRCYLPVPLRSFPLWPSLLPQCLSLNLSLMLFPSYSYSLSAPPSKPLKPSKPAIL